jgi:hypothetical protein
MAPDTQALAGRVRTVGRKQPVDLACLARGGIMIGCRSGCDEESEASEKVATGYLEKIASASAERPVNDPRLSAMNCQKWQ